MCLMLYLGSDVPLATIAWEPDHPPLHVAELDERDAVVRQHFSKLLVYYIGAHGGCGCGFAAGSADDNTSNPDIFRPRQLLAEFTRKALQMQNDVEFFACWDGDQSHDVEHREQISPDELAFSEKVFLEKQFVVCVK